MTKALFLDRDGTINIDKDYLYRVEEFEFLPDVIEGLKFFKEQGYLLVLITNQSGIARGYYSVSDMETLHEYMQDKLGKHDVAMDAIYYCPHLPNGMVPRYSVNCDCRKPSPGLFQKAIAEFDIDPTCSIAIGDKSRDIEPLITFGGKGILLRPGFGWKEIIELYKKI